MPSGLNVDGFVTRRPGVYANVDVSALTTATLETNNLAVVGQFPFLKGPQSDGSGPDPSQVASQSALKKLEPSNQDLARLAKLIYNASADSGISGMPQSVRLVNVVPNTQASFDLVGASVGQLNLKANAWGNAGNKISVQVAANSPNAAHRDFTIKKDSLTETFSDVGRAAVFTGAYTENDDVSAATMAYTRAGGVVLALTSSSAKSNLNGLSAPNTVAAVATSTINVDARLANGDTFTLSDGTNSVNFVVNTGNDYVLGGVDASGRVIIGISSNSSSANDVTDLVTAINNVSGYDQSDDAGSSTNYTLNITAADGDGDTVTLTQDVVGSSPNGAVTQSFANAVTIDAFANGADAGMDTFSPTNVVTNGRVVATIGDASAASLGAVIINGTSTAGTTVSDTLTFVGTSATSTSYFATITSVTSTVPTTVDLAFTYTLAADAVTDVSGAVTALDAIPSLVVTQGNGSQKVPFNKLDALDAISIFSAGGTTEHSVNAHLYEAAAVLANSSLVAVADSSTATGAQIAAASIMLAGGSESAVTDANYTSALNKLREPNHQVQVIVVDSNAASVHSLVAAHCNYMAGLGRNECNAWVGAPASTALAGASGLTSKAAALNNRFVAMAFQSVKVADHLGKLVTLDPWYLALIMASMQCSSPVATPMTRKRPNVVSVSSAASISLVDDIEAILKSGIVAVVADSKGLRCERSVTTHVEDDNSVLCEVSAMESVNTSIRDLRNNLTLKIGTKNIAGTKDVLLKLTIGRLEQQVLNGIIKAFDKSSVSVEDLGDTFNINYTAAPVFPLNFIQLNASFVAAI